MSKVENIIYLLDVLYEGREKGVKFKTSDLVEKLKDKGCIISNDKGNACRTIQRYLQEVSGCFEIEKDANNEYSWSNPDTTFNRDVAYLIAWDVISKKLSNIFPDDISKKIKLIFQNKKEEIELSSSLDFLSSKIAFYEYKKPFVPFALDPEILKNVKNAVFEAKQIEIKYERVKDFFVETFTLNPVGLVIKNGLIYLIAASVYDKPSSFYAYDIALIKGVEEKKQGCGNSYDLKSVLEKNDVFSSFILGREIDFSAIVEKDELDFITKNKFLRDQKVSNLDGKFKVDATVSSMDVAELFVLLMRLTPYIEVEKPHAMRQAMQYSLCQLKRTYQI